jgi:hypothetical protein
MLLLEGTEPEKESMTVRLGLGGRMSRIDAIAHILNTAGSEEDGQPYSEARLPALADDLGLAEQEPKDLKQVTGGGVNARKKNAESRASKG